MCSCILVFGVSGVGKTTACENYVARHPGFLFVSASALLKSIQAASAEELRTAKREQIIENQALLPDALKRYRLGRRNHRILLDAHAVIDNDRALVEVPVSVIGALEPTLLVLLEATPAEIAKRRSADARPRPLRDLQAIAREITAERTAVEAYGVQLGLDVAVATVGPHFSLDDILGR
ncbi:ATP-binding protein [Sphingomonas gei]|nr:AAA family ATPase [Sphingomonas gei]